MQPDASDAARTPVLVAYDGSEPARKALFWAAAEAAGSGRALRLVHVLRWPLPELDRLDLPAAVHDASRARKLAAELVDAAVEWCKGSAPKIDVRGEVLTGSAIDLLVKLAAEASLLVLGASGQTAGPRVLLGSSAAEIARRVTVPVAVVRDLPEGGRGRVVIGVDGSPTSLDAVRIGFDIAARRGLGVVAVHAWSDLPLEALTLHAYVDENRGEADAEALLAEQLAEARKLYPQVPVEEVVVLDRPARALLGRATGAALLVVGRHGREMDTATPLGSVCHAVLHYAPCPVLLTD
jgi:nucleotide-binding universal stress UspA family protein